MRVNLAESFEDVSFTTALEKRLSVANEEESPIDGFQITQSQLVNVWAAQELISRIDENRSNILNSHQCKLESKLFNVVSCRNRGGLKLGYMISSWSKRVDTFEENSLHRYFLKQMYGPIFTCGKIISIVVRRWDLST